MAAISPRTSRKAVASHYFEAHAAVKQFAAREGAPEYQWIEVIEGEKPDTPQYVIHAATSEAAVPSFAIETYQRGVVRSFEANRAVIQERALMPEELRQRMVSAQMATSHVMAAGVPTPVPALRAA